MAQRTDDQQTVFGITVLSGLGLIGLIWHYATRFLIPDPDRLDMVELLKEHWRHLGNFEAYAAWRWDPMIAVGYPLAFLATVLPSVLVYGGIVAAERRNWLSLAHAVGGWLVGGLLGYALMQFAPMPNELVRAFTLPALALLVGGTVPFLFAPSQDARSVRGTRIVQSRGNSLKMAQSAIKAGRTALAGVMLSPKAEVSHFAMLGVTGSGKSAAMLGMMYTAMVRGDRHIVADPDGGAMTRFFMPGDVILNPSDARSAKWDILAEIEEPTDYRLLSEALVPFPKDGNNDWVRYAQEIFAACLESWHVHKLGTSDAFLLAMATADKEKLAALCEGMPAYRYFEGGNEKMVASIMGTLAPALGDLRPLAQVQGEAFSVRRWMRNGQGNLWMPYRATQIPALRNLISCWMGLSIAEALSFSDSEQRRMWFHIDELDALGRIQGLKDALARLRKKGCCVAMGVQSIAQVRAVYGEAEAHTIVENCDNKLILRCGASEGGGTARFASQVIGEREVERDETTTSRSSGRHASTSTSNAVRVHREAAVMDSEIMRLEPCHGYLKVATQPDWQQVSFQPMSFKTQTDAFLPKKSPVSETIVEGTDGMPYQNPYYDPDWKSICDFHYERAEHFSQEMSRLAGQGEAANEAYKIAKTECDRHRFTSQDSFKMQHKTVQEYAEWLFKSFPVKMGTHDTNVVAPKVDFSNLRTIEDVNTEWSRVHRIVEEAANEQRSLLHAKKLHLV